jgi:hypothetical protein
MSMRKHRASKRFPQSEVAKVLSAALAVTSVVSAVPMNVVKADVSAAMDAVNSAGTDADLQAALTNPALGLDLTGYNALSSSDQINVINALLAERGAGFSDPASVQVSLDNAVATYQANLPLDAVNQAADASSMLTALEAPALSLVLGDYHTWNAVDKFDVASTVLSARPGGGFSTVNEVQTAFNAALAMRSGMASVNMASTALNMKDAYEDATIGLTLGSYAGWSEASQALVSQLVLESRPQAGYMDPASLQAAFDAALTSIAPIANVNAATSSSEMQTALEDAGLGLTISSEYSALSPSTKAAVAENVRISRSSGGYISLAAIQTAFDLAVSLQMVNTAVDAASMQNAISSSVLALNMGVSSTWAAIDRTSLAEYVRSNKGLGFLTVASLQSTVNQGIVSLTPLANVNMAATDVQMQTALEASGLLTLTTYNTYAAVDKTAVAKALLEAKPVSGFNDAVSLQNEFVTSVNARQYIAAVNKATTALSMKTALEAAELGLTLGIYAQWQAADQEAVAAQVLASRPIIGYADANAVQVAFDAAVSAHALLVPVNTAATASDMQTALQDIALGLSLTVYSTWMDVDKGAVAAEVLAVRPVSGFANKAAVQLAVNTAVTARTPVATVNLASSASSMETALENGALGIALGSYATWKAADQAAVATDVLASRPVGGFADKSAIQSDFNAAINTRTPVAAVNLAVTASELRTALEDVSLGLTQGGYAGWLDADKAAVADQLLAERPAAGYADLNTLQNAFDAALLAREGLVLVNSAASDADMQNAIENAKVGLSLTVYNTWVAADKAAVAAEVLAVRPVSGFANKAAVQQAVNTVVTARTPVATLNLASSDSSMETALENGALGIALGSYATWKAADQAAVATDVLASRPVGGFADKSAVQSDFDKAVTARQPMALVNLAADAAHIKSSLLSSNLLLDLTDYNALSKADQSAVAENILSNRPAGGFKDQNALELALASAISADAPLAAVNNAADAQAMETALENVALGLTFGTYNSWLQADQADVAAQVLSARPADGYASSTAVQTAFNAAVTARTHIAAVNMSADIASLQTALKASGLGLTLGVYMNYKEADQAAVASAVLAGRPGTGFEDVQAVQTAFNAAVAIRTPVAAVNMAATASELRTALEDLSLGLTQGSYEGWLDADKAAVADQLLAERPAAGYADLNTLQNAFDAALLAREGLVLVNSAVSDADMQNAIENAKAGLSLTVYSTWKTADKAVVAAAVRAARPVSGFANKAAVQQELNTAITARTPVAVVNIAASAAAMETAVESSALNLSLGAYATWKAADQAAVATDLLAALPAGGYADQAAVQTAFNMAVAARQPMAVVNQAPDSLQLQSSLQNSMLGLDMTAYNALTTADQNAVIAAVLTARPTSGYADPASLQQEIDAAIAANAPMAAVNQASDAAAMKTALELQALGLILNEYNTWLQMDQDVVATGVLEGRPSAGYTNSAAVQTAFQTKLLARQAVANVNKAGTAIAMRTALENSALGLNLSAYQQLSLTDQAAAAETAVTSKPQTGLTDPAAIQAFVDRILIDMSLQKNRDALAMTYTQGDSADRITGSLTLPAAGLPGSQVTVTWESTHPEFIAHDGSVTRPSYQTGDVTVVMKAHLSKGSVTVHKDFTVKVAAKELTPAPLAGNITVVNSSDGVSDQVIVNGMTAGDIVTVYNADGSAKLGETTVLSGNASATVNIAQLGTGSGTVTVTATRSGLQESFPVSKVYAAENAKPYLIENGMLTRADSLVAKVTIQPTEGLLYSGKKYVVFEGMSGTTPVGIIVLEYTGQSAEELTARFMQAGAISSVKVFVVDSYGITHDSIGSSLAKPVTLQLQ